MCVCVWRGDTNAGRSLMWINKYRHNECYIYSKPLFVAQHQSVRLFLTIIGWSAMVQEESVYTYQTKLTGCAGLRVGDIKISATIVQHMQEIDKRGRGVKQKLKAKGKSVWERKGRNTSVLRYSETQDTGSRTATWYHGLLLCWRWRRKSCRHGCTVCLYRYTYYPGCRLRMRWVR